MRSGTNPGDRRSERFGPSKSTAKRQAPEPADPSRVCVGQCVHPCETCFENVANKNYELGQVVVLEGLPKLFATRAGEAFAAKRDDEARWLRKLSDEFQARAEASRQEYSMKYHDVSRTTCKRCGEAFGPGGTCNNESCA